MPLNFYRARRETRQSRLLSKSYIRDQDNDDDNGDFDNPRIGRGTRKSRLASKGYIHEDDDHDNNGDSDDSRIRDTQKSPLTSKNYICHHNHDNDDDSGDSEISRILSRRSARHRHRLSGRGCIHCHNHENNNDNGDSEDSPILPKSLSYYFKELFEKRVASREEALSRIIKTLLVLRLEKEERDFLEDNLVTLTYYCFRCIKKSSVASEVKNAVYAIGLVAMFSEYVGPSHETYVDVLSAVSNGIKSKVDINGKVLECLAIVTFFGACNSDETEKAMQLIWNFILPQSGSSKKNEHSSPVLATAISAWTFLLTTLDGWRLSYKIWQGATSCFSNLLNDKDETVCAVAREALALISESNCIEKFSNKDKDSEKLHELIACIPKCKTYSESINGRYLILTSHSQIIQMKYIRRFLGEEGFIRHMMKNENLREVFEFSRKINRSSCRNVLYEPEREEVQVRFFQRPVPIQEDGSLLPFVSRENKQIIKRMTKSGNSNLSKARTILLKKKRCIQEEENNYLAD